MVATCESLADWCERYVSERDLARSTVCAYRSAVSRFETWSGGPTDLEGLARRLSEFVTALISGGANRRTVHSYRRQLLTLLRAADDAGLVVLPKVRPVKLPQLIPRALTHREIRQLLFASYSQPHGNYQRAAVWLAYNTAFRRSDIFRATWRDVGSDGRIRLVVSKTGRVESRTLWEDTRAACAMVADPEDDRLVPWPYTMSSWHKAWKKLARAAGLEKVAESGLQMLRRSAASYSERDGSPAWRILGHSPRSIGLAQQYYLDPSIAYPDDPEPPRFMPDG